MKRNEIVLIFFFAFIIQELLSLVNENEKEINE